MLCYGDMPLLKLFKVAQLSTIFWGYFCKQICCQELSKIAQYGHTATIVRSSALAKDFPSKIGIE